MRIGKTKGENPTRAWVFTPFIHFDFYKKTLSTFHSFYFFVPYTPKIQKKIAKQIINIIFDLMNVCQIVIVYRTKIFRGENQSNNLKGKIFEIL